MTEYPVYQGDQSVGSAVVSLSGLYYHIRCSCKPADDKIYRLMAVDTNGNVELGVLVPTNGKYCINKKLPVKRFKGDILRFFLFSENSTDEKRFIPVDPQCTFDAIAQLESARFGAKEGKYGLFF